MLRIALFTKFSLIFSGVWSLLVIAWATYNFYYFQSLIEKKVKIFASQESRFVELWTHEVGGRWVLFDVDLLPLEIVSTVIFPSVTCLALGAIADRIFARKSRKVGVGNNGA